MDDERKIILYFIARKLHLERMIICLMHVVMTYVLVHRHYDIGDDEENSLMSVSQISYSQQTNRRKRSRPSDGIALGLDNIAESLRQMMEEADQHVHVLADSIRPKLDEKMQQFLLAELRRLRLSVGIRIKAINMFSEKPQKFDMFKRLDEDEEKLEFISQLIGGSSHG